MFGKVSKPGVLSAATGANPLRQDPDTNLVVQATGARYWDLVKSGRVFSVSNQAVVSTTAALATTWTGLGVCNPATSTVDLVMLRCGVGQVAAGAAGAVGIMVADTTGLVAAITPKNALVGSTVASQSIVDDGGTIGTPILYRVYGSVGSVATTAYGLVPGVFVDLDGSLVIQPGYAALSYTTAATTTALIFHFVWAEMAR
jgi:hypothetical protein